MPNLTIEIPADIVMALKLPHKDAPSVLQRELALQLYSQDFLSFGKARQLAQLSKWQFAELLGERGIKRHYDEQSLTEDSEFANVAK